MIIPIDLWWFLFITAATALAGTFLAWANRWPKLVAVVVVFPLWFIFVVTMFGPKYLRF